MKRLTENEIRFVKETGFTPTVWQCDEYDRTIFTDECSPSYDEGGFESLHEWRIALEEYENKYFKIASAYAKDHYGFDLLNFLDKNLGSDLDDNDGISLEYVATYLFYAFFTKEELLELTDEEATKWLKDYRYFCGFRKWDGGNLVYVEDAIRAHNGEIEFYEVDEQGNIWWREKHE